MPSNVASFLYIAFNKPYGVVSQFTDKDGHPGLNGFGLPAGVYPAGRLDSDSEGLLLLTSDGFFQHALCEPEYGHKRIYQAQVERVPDNAALERLRRGVLLKDGPTKPCSVSIITAPPLPLRSPPVRFRKSVPTAWVEIELSEGRNRQVRRMLAAVGYPVLRLHRREMAGIACGGLAPGEWRFLSGAELETARGIKNAVKRRPINK